ncbi:MAG: calcium-translocating P-type ATPase, PMCA-type [Deltaproteobacteria bacterium]|nr:calcium-translocating P-type ATPase, PMCA-type [Deltaproteobacteria bacterium]
MSKNNILLKGLTSNEIEKIRNEKGTNAMPPPPVRHWFQLLLGVAADKTIIILSVAAAISIGISLYSGENIFEGLGILIAVGIAIFVGFLSELRSNRAFQSLIEESEKIRVKVVRDGKFHTVTSDDIVCGDVVLLETGDKIPADGKILQTIELTFNTSMITGESASLSAEEGTEVFRGFSVLTGEGAMLVEKVGMQTEMGKIREALAGEPEPTPLQERLGEMADKIGLLGTAAALAIFFALLLRNYFVNDFALISAQMARQLLNAFIVAVTIVVVAVPEGLPLAVTLSLALNMRRMAKDKNLVRTLSASETLGSATVICSDKTGTLTLNRMRVSSLWTPEGKLEGAVSKCILEGSDRLFNHLLAVNSTAHLEEKNSGKMDYIGNPTEGSMLLLLNEKGKNYLQIRENTDIITRKPFSSARKMMSTLINWDEKSKMLLVKGAPERILEKCIDSASYEDSELIPLSELNTEINQILEKSAGRGERVLALAWKKLPSDTVEYDENGMTLWGFVIIRDPVRKEVAGAIRECNSAGIDVKIVTGDNPLTAKSIGEELNLMMEDDIILEGDEFEKMSDSEITEILPRLRILARSRPNDKFRLVSLLKDAKEVVAVTGDGTNDAPAMRKADVGVSMGISGTEVAKEASDVVLLDDNFSSIVKGVLWGRNLQTNIRRFLQFQLTVNVAALSVAFVGALIGGKPPLTAVQLLWVNLIMDTLAAVALGLEPPQSHLMKSKPKDRTAPLITRPMWYMILGVGFFTFISLIALTRWNFMSEAPEGSLEHMSIIFTTFVFIQVFNEINARSIDGKNPFSGIMKSHGFLIIMAFIVLIQGGLTQFGGKLFQTQGLSLIIWLKIIAFSSTTLLAGAVIRLFIRKSETIHETA